MYVIHACNERMWYVKDYLIPSLQKQGIYDIHIWQDKYQLGNLGSCMSCFSQLPKYGGAWHLQDDVLVSENFKEVTKKQTEYGGIACGFCCFDLSLAGGKTTVENMWYSFQCIYIPNHIARECARWYFTEFQTYMLKEYGSVVDVRAGKGDDAVFRCFLEQKYPNIEVTNIKPNIVEHVDDLIGGSVTNTTRNVPSNSRFFEDKHLVDALKEKLGK